MAYNKFRKQDGTILLDLTEDTVTPETLSKGVTAHNRHGEAIVGVHVAPIPEGYIKPEGEKVITQNGYYDVRDVVGASVQVSPPIPDGWLLPTGTREITANGSYDISEFAQVRVDVQGGNSDLEEEWIKDGNTHIWVTIPEGRKSPILSLCPYGTVTINWGDNTEPETLTGTSILSAKYTPTHEYAEAGDYIITLTVDGTLGIVGDSNATSGSAGLLRCVSTSDTRNLAYANLIHKIEIGDNVINLGGYAFKNCRSLEKILLSNSITAIGSNVFDSCYSLTEVTLPTSITTIGDYMFQNCYSLNYVNIPAEITSIGLHAFNGCHSLVNIDLPLGITEIKNYCFFGCDSLASITIPGTVTKIGLSAFNQCTSLTTVRLPKSITSFANSAFANCTGAGLYDFTQHESVPLLNNTGVFSKMPTDCKILVQSTLVDTWKATTNWAIYADRIVGV